jgi:hypothetical protein
MKLIIAGGRNYKFADADIARLDAIREEITEVVSGGATGADREGERWAEKHEIPVKVFPADWERHGKSAGPRRNREMAAYADAVVLFPGGRGTINMMIEAQMANLKIYDWMRR